MKTLIDEIIEMKDKHLKANEKTYKDCLTEENGRLGAAYDLVLAEAHKLSAPKESEPYSGAFRYDILPNGNLRFTVCRPADAVEFLGQETAEIYMLAELFEEMGWTGNGHLYEVAPEDIGALTCAPIITDDLDIEDNGDRKVLGKVWWFPNYMVESWVETLHNEGEVIFTFAPVEEMKKKVAKENVYKGKRVDNYAIVEVNGKQLDIRISQKLFNHSMDGFEWGYGGSGPAQLALAILFHETDNAQMSVKLHQKFKEDMVSTWAHESWKINSAVIDIFLTKALNDKDN